MSPTVLATGRRLAVCTLLLCCAAMLWHGSAAAATPAAVVAGGELPAHESVEDAATGRSGSARSARQAVRRAARVRVALVAVSIGATHGTESVRTPAAVPSHGPPGRAPPSE